VVKRPRAVGVRRRRIRSRLQASFQRGFYVLIALVALLVVHLWRKVEAANVARRVDAARTRIENLDEERSRLVASIAFHLKPGAIQGLAVTQLGMVYPSGQLTEVTYDPRPSERAQ
jgi:hypothetical protein